MNELPADTATAGLAGAIVGDAVANPFKSHEFLDVDMDHLSGMALFITPDWFGWLKLLQPRQPRSFQNPADGG